MKQDLSVGQLMSWLQGLDPETPVRFMYRDNNDYKPLMAASVMVEGDGLRELVVLLQQHPYLRPLRRQHDDKKED
jgi:hypothetical protein